MLNQYIFLRDRIGEYLFTDDEILQLKDALWSVIEFWRDIKGFEGLYQISNLGRVRRLSKIGSCHRYLTIKKGKRGYLYAALHKNGKAHNKYIHNLIGLAFIKNPKNKPQINHIDRIRWNNSLDNLEWVTSRENITHSALARKTTSQYTGVYYMEKSKKWRAIIVCNKKNIFLGYFKTEIEAHEIYQKALIEFNQTGQVINNIVRLRSNPYKGVAFDKGKNKWRCVVNLFGKKFHVGYFDNKIMAWEAHIKKKAELLSV